MAGLPWIIVFAVLSMWAISRGHRLGLQVLWLVMLGIGLGNTSLGSQAYGVVTNVLTAVWSAVVTAITAAVG